MKYPAACCGVFPQIEYVGRTKHLKSRITAHENSTNRSDLKLAFFIRTQSYPACRAIEQAAMLGAQTLKEKDSKECNNQINGVGIKNSKAKVFYEAANCLWTAEAKMADYILNQKDNERLNQIETYIQEGLDKYCSTYCSNY